MLYACLISVTERWARIMSIESLTNIDYWCKPIVLLIDDVTIVAFWIQNVKRLRLATNLSVCHPILASQSLLAHCREAE